jgi:competence protein ComFC
MSCHLAYNDHVLQRLSSIGREAARIVLHAPCVVCERELPWRARTASCCATCWAAMPRMTTAACTSCALPLTCATPEQGDTAVLTAPAGERCIDCLVEPLPLEWCRAWGHYRGSLARVLQALKFQRHDFLAAPLGRLLFELMVERGDMAFDAVVPVPMHRRKLRHRGYNQAELLARTLSATLGLPCEPRLLATTGERATQSKLNRLERRVNVKGAFQASTHAAGRSLLLVDDVCTTGETLRACSAALSREKASRVCAIVVAKAG